ncbi:hypothetical protein ACSBR2_018115 [Camellia fascicularis]
MRGCNGTFISTILTSATLLRSPIDANAIPDDIKVEVGVYVMNDEPFNGHVIAYDFHFNIATISIETDVALPTAIIRPLYDSISIDSNSVIINLTNQATAKCGKFGKRNLVIREETMTIEEGSYLFSNTENVMEQIVISIVVRDTNCSCASKRLIVFLLDHSETDENREWRGIKIEGRGDVGEAGISEYLNFDRMYLITVTFCFSATNVSNSFMDLVKKEGGSSSYHQSYGAKIWNGILFWSSINVKFVFGEILDWNWQSQSLPLLRANAASGMAVHDDCKLRFMELKTKRTYRFIVFKIEEKQKQVIMEKVGEPAQSYEDFTASLPADECRYAVYDFDFDFMTAANVPKSRIFFIAWSPDTSRVRSKMIYASSKDRFKRELDGI